MKLILVRGCPGTGKSTFVGKAFPGVFHVENDMWHIRNGKYDFDCRGQDKAVSWCLDTCEQALEQGMDCVVSNTFTKTSYIEAYRRIAERNNAEFSVYRMHGDFSSAHDVPAGVLENMKKKFADWPDEIHVYPNGADTRSEYSCTDISVGDTIELTGIDDGGTVTASATAAYGFGLAALGDRMPYVDSFTTTASVVAMWLSVRRYAEQWWIWIAVDVFSVWMWWDNIQAGNANWATLIMWTVFLANAVYGCIKWELNANEGE